MPRTKARISKDNSYFETVGGWTKIDGPVSPHASGFFAFFEIPGMSLAVCLKERSYHNHHQEPVFSIDPKTQNTTLLMTNHATTQFQPNPIKNIIVYRFYHLVLLDFPIGYEFYKKNFQKSIYWFDINTLQMILRKFDIDMPCYDA